MGFKHGRLAETWLDGINATQYLNSFDFDSKTDTADSTVFQKTWKTAITGASKVVTTAHGFYEPANGAFQPPLSDSVLTYGPAGLLVVGDLARLIDADETSFKQAAPVGGIVAFDLGFESSDTVGFGACLAPLAAHNVGTITGTSDTLVISPTPSIGLVAHLHFMAMTGGDTHTAKLQDSADNAAWADVTAGAFASITAIGAQRLVVPGVVRAYVRVVVTVNGHAATYACAAARK